MKERIHMQTGVRRMLDLTGIKEEDERERNEQKEWIKKSIFKGIEEAGLIEFEEKDGVLEGFLHVYPKAPNKEEKSECEHVYIESSNVCVKCGYIKKE